MFALGRRAGWVKGRGCTWRCPVWSQVRSVSFPVGSRPCICALHRHRLARNRRSSSSSSKRSPTRSRSRSPKTRGALLHTYGFACAWHVMQFFAPGWWSARCASAFPKSRRSRAATATAGAVLISFIVACLSFHFVLCVIAATVWASWPANAQYAGGTSWEASACTSEGGVPSSGVGAETRRGEDGPHWACTAFDFWSFDFCLGGTTSKNPQQPDESFSQFVPPPLPLDS